MANPSTVKVAFLGDASQLAKASRQAQRSLDGVAGHAEKSSKRMGLASKAAMAGAVAGVGGIFKASIGLEAQFSQTMNTMAAVADVPADGIKNLSALAIKMGADTVFSANDASEAMLELAKGGLTAAQIEAGALKATMTLAAAGGLDMATAATFASNAMNAFSLKAEDAGAVAAALAGGANASSASVESLGQALAQVGPGAVNAGLSLQETVAALAAFDNAGIKGSDAGTSLKTMLTRLVPQTKKTQNAMRDLGLDFTDATGAFVPLENIAGQLQAKLGKLSEEQRTTALATIFGSDATRAASVLVKEGAKGIAEMTKKTSDLSAAQRVADARMKGTAGSIEAMKGSLETAGLSIGQMVAPAVIRLSKDVASMTNFMVKNKAIVGPLALAVGALAVATYTVNKAMAAGRAVMAASLAVKTLFTGATVAQTGAIGAQTVATNVNTAANWRNVASMRAARLGALAFAAAAVYAGSKWAEAMNSSINAEAAANDRGGNFEGTISASKHVQKWNLARGKEWSSSGLGAKIQAASKAGDMAAMWQYIRQLEAIMRKNGTLKKPQSQGMKMAEGGIVKRRPGGMQATIGEGKHDEAVIPLPRGRRGLGLGGDTYYIDARGAQMGAAQEIVRALRAYKRTTGQSLGLA